MLSFNPLHETEITGLQNATFAGVEPGGLAVLALVVIPRRPLGGEDVERG